MIFVIKFLLTTASYKDKNLMIENTIFEGKPVPLGISANKSQNMLLNITRFGKYHQE